MMGKIIGIDAGTGNSVVSIYDSGKVTVIPNSEGAMTTPSVVAYGESGRMVGRIAKSQAAINPTRTISSVKRFIGRLRSEVASEEKLVQYKVVGEPHELAQIDIDGKRLFPQEITAAVLSDLKKSAEAYLGEKVSGAVISIPAYFSSAQREATKEAGVIAGLDVKRIVSEPTCAALAYGMDKQDKQKIIVYDIGQGTYDLSCISIEAGLFEVLAVNGDAYLGGDCWDKALVDHVADEFKTANGIDLRLDPMALQRLTEACEKAKCDLSTTVQATINIPYVTALGGTPRHLSTTITRTKFETICAPLFERLRAPAIKALADAKLSPSDISAVILVGGATRMLRAQEICKELFGKEPNKSVSPDLAVSIGAAIQGSILSGDITDLVLLDVTPLTLGVETMGGIMSPLIPRNSTIPIQKSEVFTTASDNQPAVDIHVLQGESKLASKNRTIGRFQLSGIPPQPRGIPQIEVFFDIDSNGIISVSAKDKNTGKSQKVEIKASSGLDKSDIDRMVSEAASSVQDEQEKVDLITARNTADNLIYHTEKFLRENIKPVSESRKASVIAALSRLKSALDRNATKADLRAEIDGVAVENAKMKEELDKPAPQPQPAPAPIPPKPNIETPDDF